MNNLPFETYCQGLMDDYEINDCVDGNAII